MAVKKESNKKLPKVKKGTFMYDVLYGNNPGKPFDAKALKSKLFNTKPGTTPAKTKVSAKTKVAASKSSTDSDSWNEAKVAMDKAKGALKAAMNKANAAVDKAKPSATKSTFNLDAEVKKTMRGQYGNGAARKSALGDNYSKVQAEVNKRIAAKKSASAPKAKTKREIPSMSTKSAKEAIKSVPTPQPKAKSKQVESSEDDNMLVNKPGYGAKKTRGGAVKK